MISRHFQSDGNTKNIVAKWREGGGLVFYWQPVNRQKGMPDLIIPYAGITWLVEVKRPGEELKPDQIAWHADWKRHGGGPVVTIRTFEELLVAVGAEPAF